MRSIAVTAAAVVLSLFVARAVIYAQSPSPSPTATPMTTTPSAAPSTGLGGK